MSLSLGLGLALTRNKGVRLFPQASAGWDFVRGAYKNASGYVRTNTVTNPLMTGGVAGVLGSGGSLPTGWSYSTTITGLTYTVSYGSVGGRPYIDFRASGTAGGSSYLNLNFASASPSASNGQTWTNAADIALQAGSLTNISQSVMQINENTSGGAYVSGGSTGNLALTSTPARFWYTRTLSGGGTVGKALPIFTFNVAAAGAVDVTYRIFAPQMEQTAYPTSFLVGATTTFTSTNPADVGNMTFTRASTGYAEDAQGNLVLFGPGVPRITNRGVLIEAAATNSIRNSTPGNGAIVGVIGSGGAAGTNWGVSAAGPTVTIVGTGTEGGLPYLDVRVAGTSSLAEIAFFFEGSSAVAAASGQTWTYSQYIRLAGGDLTNITATQLVLYERNNVGSALGNTPVAATLTETRSRPYVTRTLNQATTAFVSQKLILVPVIGQPVDFTLRIFPPQMEQGSVPSSYIPTTSVAATRAADVFYYSGASVASSFTLAATIDHAFANSGAGYYPVVSIGGSFNNIAAIVRRDISNGYQGLIRSSSATVADMVDGGAPQSGVHHLALRVNDNQFALAKDGAIISTDTVGTSPALNGDRLAIGTESWSPGSRGVMGYIPRIALFPYAASDAQLQTISSGQF